MGYAAPLPMLTFSASDALADQRNLDSLCADRPVPSYEVHSENPLYGHAGILKRYAGLPRRYALKIAIPHGVNFARTFSSYSPRELVPVLTYWRDHDRATIRGQNVQGRLWPMAAPFCYALRSVKRVNSAGRRGTIFFPSHSTPNTSADVDFGELADTAAGLSDSRGPVTVCLYWRDIQLGHHRPFLDRGLDVVSAGHIHDEWFLYRLVHLCSLHRFAATNEIGSHCFYAIAAGCRLSFVGPSRRNAVGIYGDVESGAESFFAGLETMSDDEQRLGANEFLGVQYLETPGQLRRTLLSAEALDKFGLIEPTADDASTWVVPPVGRRAVRKVARPILRRAKGRHAAT